MVEPLTPERRRALTRSHLLAAAGEVFRRRGFHGASIDEVAAAAGFTKGAVYSNFKNKEDLFLALMDQRTEQQLAVVKRAVAETADLPADERTTTFSHLTAELLWGDREWQLLNFEYALYAARNPSARQALAERYRAEAEVLAPVVEAELARVGKRSPLPVADLIAIFVALFVGISLKHASNPDEADDTLVESAIAFLNYATDTFPPRAT